MKDVLIFFHFLLPDLFPCIAVSLPVKLKTNNYRALYCFHVKDDKKRLFMNVNTKTPVLPISYKLGFAAQGAQRNKGSSCLGWKSLESLLTQRYLQACPLPPEQQNDLNHVLVVHLVLLDPHCNMK